MGDVVSLKVEDYFQTGKRSLIRFNGKGGKEKEIPVHGTPLFPTTLDAPSQRQS
jgi:hypothetical protein